MIRAVIMQQVQSGTCDGEEFAAGINEKAEMKSCFKGDDDACNIQVKQEKTRCKRSREG